MKYASPASSRVRRLVSSLRMIAAPVRCSVNEVAADSGAPVALNPTSRTRQTSGPSTPIKPWAMVWTWGAPAVNSAGAAAAWRRRRPRPGSARTAAGEGGCAGRSCAAARSACGQQRRRGHRDAQQRGETASRSHWQFPRIACPSHGLLLLCLPGTTSPDPAAGTRVGANAADASSPSPAGNVDRRGSAEPFASRPAQVGRLYFCLVPGVAKRASTLAEST